MPILAKKRFRFHGLKRPKIRQDMKKETLYNLARMSPQNTSPRTYFQQKWTAKAMTRAYHGEQMKETSWIHIHSRTAPSAVPMNPTQLARDDGSEQAAGRGSGLTPPPDAPARMPQPTPYMQMLYHPMERRLDTAIFRSLFASSARQARQMVVHGHVKVNGKTMRYPGYMLNPGDLFQVDPERVMTALGKQKAKATVESVEEGVQEEAARADAVAAEEDVTEEQEEQDSAVMNEILAEEEVEEIAESDPQATTKRTLRELRKNVRDLVDAKRKDLPTKRLRDLRALSKELRSAMSKAATLTPSELEDLQTQTNDLVNRPVSAAVEAAKETQQNKSEEQVDEKSAAFDAAVQQARENPYDPSKPYHTPWQPRDFLSAFAFVPRYLEVNHNICAAVYIRHPVCYPGFAEVPTPFSFETSQLAFNWYLRRR